MNILAAVMAALVVGCGSEVQAPSSTPTDERGETTEVAGEDEPKGEKKKNYTVFSAPEELANGFTFTFGSVLFFAAKDNELSMEWTKKTHFYDTEKKKWSTGEFGLYAPREFALAVGDELYVYMCSLSSCSIQARGTLSAGDRTPSEMGPGGRAEALLFIDANNEINLYGGRYSNQKKTDLWLYSRSTGEWSLRFEDAGDINTDDAVVFNDDGETYAAVKPGVTPGGLYKLGDAGWTKEADTPSGRAILMPGNGLYYPAQNQFMKNGGIAKNYIDLPVSTDDSTPFWGLGNKLYFVRGKWLYAVDLPQ